MDDDDAYERAMKEYLEDKTVMEFADPAQPYPTRKELWDRPMKILEKYADAPPSPRSMRVDLGVSSPPESESSTGPRS